MVTQQPIIILGMHRSGTTLVTRLLEQLGLFMGEQKEVNEESLFFWEINNWIFELHTALPELPHNLKYTNPKTKSIIEDSLSYWVQSSRRKKYLGTKTTNYSSILDIDFPFGWKDPKNTFTLDFWKSVFPNPKIIHVYRNPIDSISSYIERDLAMKNNFSWTWKKQLKRRFMLMHKFHYNFRPYNLEQGFDLWCEYVTKALQHKETNENYMEIKYEDFLDQPEAHLIELCSFCGLTASIEEIQRQIHTIRKDRAYAFLGNNEYYQFYQTIQHHSLLQQLGYNNL